MKFCWSTLHVKSMQESLWFYQEVVGLKLERLFQAAPGMEIAFLGSGETKIELIVADNNENIEVGKDISCIKVSVFYIVVLFTNQTDLHSSLYSMPQQNHI